MSKKVIDEKGAHQIINRALLLTPATKPVWGIMTADEMLYHCNITNNEILNTKPYPKKANFKQRFLKILVMHILKKIPRGAKINLKFLKKEQQILNFDSEKKIFIETIIRFANHKEAIHVKHPVFGRLTTKEWKHFVWMHMDHHLRQFGV